MWAGPASAPRGRGSCPAGDHGRREWEVPCSLASKEQILRTALWRGMLDSRGPGRGAGGMAGGGGAGGGSAAVRPRASQRCSAPFSRFHPPRQGTPEGRCAEGQAKEAARSRWLESYSWLGLAVARFALHAQSRYDRACCVHRTLQRLCPPRPAGAARLEHHAVVRRGRSISIYTLYLSSTSYADATMWLAVGAIHYPDVPLTKSTKPCINNN